MKAALATVGGVAVLTGAATLFGSAKLAAGSAWLGVKATAFGVGGTLLVMRALKE